MKELRILLFLVGLFLVLLSSSKLLHLHYKNLFSKKGFVVEVYETKELERKRGTRFPLKAQTDYKDEVMFTPKALEKPFSTVWKGRLHVKEKGKYLFYIQCNDSFAFYVNGTQEMKRDGEFTYFTPGEKKALVLDPGFHPIEIHHHQVGKEGLIKVRWKGKNIPKNTVLGWPYVHKPLN